MAKICLIFVGFLLNSINLIVGQDEDFSGQNEQPWDSNGQSSGWNDQHLGRDKVSWSPNQESGHNGDENCDPNDPNTFKLSIEKMCELVPERGYGGLDIIRIYYNPVLQQCLPFSWSGEGGNANRFISIKNCYEICHPSDPGQRLLGGSGLRSYLVDRKPPQYCDGNGPRVPELGIKQEVPNNGQNGNLDANQRAKQDKFERSRDVVYRKIPHPYDPSKTLTIIQPVSYLIRDPNKKPRVIIEKHIVHVPYTSNSGPPIQTRYG